MKAAPRLAVGSRSASNASVPALLSKLLAAFKALDNIIQGLDEPDPQFVGEYLKARVVVYGRGGGGKDDDETPPADEPKK